MLPGRCAGESRISHRLWCRSAQAAAPPVESGVRKQAAAGWSAGPGRHGPSGQRSSPAGRAPPHLRSYQHVCPSRRPSRLAQARQAHTPRRHLPGQGALQQLRPVRHLLCAGPPAACCLPPQRTARADLDGGPADVAKVKEACAFLGPGGTRAARWQRLRARQRARPQLRAGQRLTAHTCAGMSRIEDMEPRVHGRGRQAAPEALPGAGCRRRGRGRARAQGPQQRGRPALWRAHAGGHAVRQGCAAGRGRSVDRHCDAHRDCYAGVWQGGGSSCPGCPGCAVLQAVTLLLRRWMQSCACRARRGTALAPSLCVPPLDARLQWPSCG